MVKLQLGIQVITIQGQPRFRVTINNKAAGKVWQTYQAANNYRLSWLKILSPEAELDHELQA